MRTMTSRAGHRAAIAVGAVTLPIGAALLVAPGWAGPLIGLTRPGGTRIIGALDVALVPGLLAGRPRWPWLAARAAANVGTAAYTLRQARGTSALTTRSRAFALAMVIATVADSTAAAATHRSD